MHASVPFALMILGIVGGGLAAPTTPPQPAGKTPVLILTGNEYPGHPWKQTAPALAEILRKDPRLEVTVVDDPAFLASPKLHGYAVIVLNYMNWKSPDPGDAARENLRKFVDAGGGLVLFHFACGAFQEWPEFRNLAGRSWDPKLRGHDPRGPFRVNIIDADHPITAGLQSFDTDDELYTCLAGDRPIRILANARSKVDGKDYPMAFVLDYGKGKVFHSVLGHDLKAMEPEGVKLLYLRGTLWSAGMSLDPAK